MDRRYKRSINPSELLNIHSFTYTVMCYTAVKFNFHYFFVYIV